MAAVRQVRYYFDMRRHVSLVLRPRLGVSLRLSLRMALSASLGALLVMACAERSPVSAAGTQLADGTWGGDTTAVIVSSSRTHIHVGCTLGEMPALVALDDRGGFAVDGSYILRAYPVQLGPELPARFTGRVVGRTVTLTIAVNDTVTKTAVTIGPVTATLGVTPSMRNCPICRVPVDTSFAARAKRFLSSILP